MVRYFASYWNHQSLIFFFYFFSSSTEMRYAFARFSISFPKPFLKVFNCRFSRDLWLVQSLYVYTQLKVNKLKASQIKTILTFGSAARDRHLSAVWTVIVVGVEAAVAKEVLAVRARQHELVIVDVAVADVTLKIKGLTLLVGRS